MLLDHSVVSWHGVYDLFMHWSCLMSINQVPVRVLQVVMAGNNFVLLSNYDWLMNNSVSRDSVLLYWDNHMMNDVLNNLDWGCVVHNWGLVMYSNWFNMVDGSCMMCHRLSVMHRSRMVGDCLSVVDRSCVVSDSLCVVNWCSMVDSWLSMVNCSCMVCHRLSVMHRSRMVGDCLSVVDRSRVVSDSLRVMVWN